MPVKSQIYSIYLCTTNEYKIIKERKNVIIEDFEELFVEEEIDRSRFGENGILNKSTRF